MSADYWANMPDPHGTDRGEADPEVDKCAACGRQQHLYSVSSKPAHAFGPMVALCIRCVWAMGEVGAGRLCALCEREKEPQEKCDCAEVVP